MGRICPILNHPLNEGVLIDDPTIVAFIQKRNVDFLPNELVCKTCKQEVIKLYNKKLKKARELQKSRLRESSVSTLKTSKTSSSATSVYGGSEPIGEVVTAQTTDVSITAGILQHHNGNSSNNTSIRQTNGSSVHSLVQQNNRNSNSILNNEQTANQNSAKIISENGTNQNINKNPASELKSLQSNVTQRKRTIRDFLPAKSPMPNINPINMSAATNAQSSTNTHNFEKRIIRHKTASESDVDDDTRRLSQEPTTSKAANRSKRPIAIIIDSDDEDDQRQSLNAVNGTRLPNVQPFPPKRRPQQQPQIQRSIARDIMDEYIKDITGG